MEKRRSVRRAASTPYRVAAVCTPGLEFVCRQELQALGCRPKPAGRGTIEFDATARQLYAANVWLRTASRLVVRVATFRATDFDRLQRAAAEADWSPWLAEGTAPTFRVSANESRLYHTKAIAQRLHEVVGARSSGGPEQLFIVRIERNTVQISADSSGAALHHRPWRTDLGPAPLRATMAAAALLAVGWDGTTSLADPFCGCGTIPIEAALLARRRPPGGARPYAFQEWPSFQPGTWASVQGEMSARQGDPSPLIVASDRDEAVVEAARGNAERAGVADDIEFSVGVVSHLKARQGPGLVLTNPPYGRRIGDDDGNLSALYRRFGAVVRQRLPDWSLAMVSADRKLAATADRSLAPVARFRHGGLPVQLLNRPAPADDDRATENDAVDDVATVVNEPGPARSRPDPTAGETIRSRSTSRSG